MAILAGIPLGMLSPGVGWAQSTGAYSADIEFIRPTFGHGSFVGVDVPMTGGPLAFRYGLVTQYERAPLTLYNRVQEVYEGAIVTNRGAVSLGASLDLSERFSVNLMLPAAFNWGTQVLQFAADGFGVGDVAGGARVIVLKTRRDLLNVGLRGGLVLPTGRQIAYMGESSVRGTVGAVAATNLGPLRLAGDAGLVLRQQLATAEDFTLGNEVTFGAGARYALPDATRLAFTAQAVSRAGLVNFLRGGAENSLEALAGVQVMPSRAVTVDLAAGRGLTEGYGTTDMRVLAAIVVEHIPKEAPPIIPPPDWQPPPPPPPPPPIVEDEPEPEWEEGEIAKVVQDKIVIRDMVEFRVDTNVLLEKSKPTLRAVADIINTEARIGHVVIEGHASQEGPYDHNYELSESRARAVFEFLLENGVHSSRMSYRGMGEVQPLVEGEDEESLQANRRVEFHIVRQYDDPEEMPDYAPRALLPWSGVEVEVIQPEKPKPPEPEVKQPALDEFGLPMDADSFEIDGDQDADGDEE